MVFSFQTDATYLAHVNATKPFDAPPQVLRNATHPYDAYMSIAKNVWQHNFSDAQITEMRSAYWGGAAESMILMRQVLVEASKAGLLNNTVVVITSDHGEMSLEHRQGLKSSLHEPSVRVPLIVIPFGVPGLERTGRDRCDVRMLLLCIHCVNKQDPSAQGSVKSHVTYRHCGDISRGACCRFTIMVQIALPFISFCCSFLAFHRFPRAGGSSLVPFLQKQRTGAPRQSTWLWSTTLTTPLADPDAIRQGPYSSFDSAIQHSGITRVLFQISSSTSTQILTSLMTLLHRTRLCAALAAT